MAKSTINSTTYEVENDDGSTRTVTQYRTTVPKSLAEAMNLDGAKVEWTIKSADAFRVKVVERGDEGE